ncbi:DUF6894 family protein [Methylobacterium segetis]|uniref:DUF6894 family protein n=1 Tax=Methylobacterium segetis TaxID=2488750 RepID=UPI0010490CE6|nr:hypothetical protein [Methylobacterium segetis]
MVRRFYFDLTDGRTTLFDTEGVLAADLNEAIVEALEGLREMRASGEIDEMGDNWKLVIRDENGSTRRTFSV